MEEEEERARRGAAEGEEEEKREEGRGRRLDHLDPHTRPHARTHHRTHPQAASHARIPRIARVGHPTFVVAVALTPSSSRRRRRVVLAVGRRPSPWSWSLSVCHSLCALVRFP